MTTLSPSKNQAESCLNGDFEPKSILVAVNGKTFEVKVASENWEWEAAFQLVRKNYLECGYEADTDTSKLVRFTKYHALPDTTVFIAKCEGEVVATFTLVPDNLPLGLPMEKLYKNEINELRAQGRRLGEVTSLAANGLSQREFVQVFMSMIRLMKQYHLEQGGDTWVITVNPRHRNFYCKTLGYTALGSGEARSYDAVVGAPAEAYWVDENRMRTHGAKAAAQIFDPVPAEALEPTLLPIDLIRELAAGSSLNCWNEVEELLGEVSGEFTAVDMDRVLDWVAERQEALDSEQVLSYVNRTGGSRRW